MDYGHTHGGSLYSPPAEGLEEHQAPADTFGRRFKSSIAAQHSRA